MAYSTKDVEGMPIGEITLALRGEGCEPAAFVKEQKLRITVGSHARRGNKI